MRAWLQNLQLHHRPCVFGHDFLPRRPCARGCKKLATSSCRADVARVAANITTAPPYLRIWSRVPAAPNLHAWLQNLQLHHYPCVFDHEFLSILRAWLQKFQPHHRPCVFGHEFQPCRPCARGCKHYNYTTVLAYLVTSSCRVDFACVAANNATTPPSLRIWSRVPTVPTLRAGLQTLQLHHHPCVFGHERLPCRSGARGCKIYNYTTVLA